MTFKDLKRQVSSSLPQQGQQQEQEQSKLALLINRLKDRPFWIEDVQAHKHEYIRTFGYCCFNHILGCPQKNDKAMPIFDYEMMLYHALMDTSADNPKRKHLWVLKSTGIGATEFFLRFMAWLCLKDNSLSGSQMCIVTGPRLDLAVSLIDRMKKLFEPKLGITFSSKETVIWLNGVKVEAYPSHHVDSMRGIPNVSFILLDEGDYFSISEQEQAHRQHRVDYSNTYSKSLKRLACTAESF